MHPLLDADRILGGFHTPTDGLVKAVRAVEAQAQAAIARGATLPSRNTEVLGILDDGRKVTGVRTADGVIAADVVVCCAGFWGAQLAKQVGLVVPLVPMAHQYATTGRIEPLVGRNTEPAEAGLPILRHQDQDLYFREHVDRIGIGYYGHEPMPVDMSTLAADTAGEQMPSMLPVHRRRLRPRLARVAETASRAERFEDRAGLQRHLLVHPRRLLDHGRAPRAERLLGRRGGLGDALGGRRQGHRGVDRRRHPGHRRPRMRSLPLRGRRHAPTTSS